MFQSLRVSLTEARLREKSPDFTGGAAKSALGSTAKLVGAVLAVSLLPGLSAAQAETTLIFGAYTSEKPSAMVQRLRPSLNEVAKAMSEILGEDIKIKTEIVRTYEDGVARIVDGKVDFMRLGPASYVVAKGQNPGLEVLAMESKRGQKQNMGIICVRTDSDISDVTQLKQRSFAFGSSKSTLGRYFAQLTLMDAGLFASDFSRYQYLGRHDKVGRAVGSGLFDAGALEETTFQKLVSQGVPVRAIASYGAATKAWVARANLNRRIEDALRQALLGLDSPTALKALRFGGFLEGSDADFDPIRAAIEQNPRFFEQPEKHAKE